MGRLVQLEEHVGQDAKSKEEGIPVVKQGVDVKDRMDFVSVGVEFEGTQINYESERDSG
jgi:hypothetical protein